MLFFPRAQAGEVMPFYDEFSSNAPDELSSMCGFLSTPDGNPVIAIVACYTGRVDEGEKVLAPLQTFGSPMADMIQPIPFLEMQKVMDESFLPGDNYYIQSGLVLRMTPEFVETCIEQAARPALAIFPASNLDDPLLQSDEPVGKIHARKTWFRDTDARLQHLAHAGELTSKRSPAFVWRTEKLTFDMQNSKELCTSTPAFLKPPAGKMTSDIRLVFPSCLLSGGFFFG